MKFFSSQLKGRTAKLQIGLLFHCCRIADLLNGLFDEDEADQRVTAHVWFPRRFSSQHGRLDVDADEASYPALT